MPLPAQKLDQIINVLEQQIINPFINFLIALAALVFVWGVIQFVINADDPKGREQGKRHIVWGILGIFIMVSAIGILNIIASIIK